MMFQIVDEGIAWNLKEHVIGKSFDLLSAAILSAAILSPASDGYKFIMQHCKLLIVATLLNITKIGCERYCGRSRLPLRFQPGRVYRTCISWHDP